MEIADIFDLLPLAANEESERADELLLLLLLKHRPVHHHHDRRTKAQSLVDKSPFPEDKSAVPR
jgi:hypothetical protein